VVQIRELHEEYSLDVIQYGPADNYICFEINLLPEGYTLKEIKMTAEVFTLNVHDYFVYSCHLVTTEYCFCASHSERTMFNTVHIIV